MEARHLAETFERLIENRVIGGGPRRSLWLVQGITFMLLGFFAASAFWTASDPFVGKWKLDVSRSTIVDVMRVEAVGPNRYRFNFEGGPAETIVANGTDQPGVPGTTLSVKAEDPHTLRVIRKRDGQVIVSATWKLSGDGRTLHDAFTSVQAEGSMLTTDYLYTRMSGTSGFGGTWESVTKPVGLKLELSILPYEDKGLSFISPGNKKSIIFDGRDHAIAGATDGSTFSAHRDNLRAMEYAQKSRGKLESVRRFALSRDDRTLTEIVRKTGQANADVLIFERE